MLGDRNVRKYGVDIISAPFRSLGDLFPQLLSVLLLRAHAYHLLCGTGPHLTGNSLGVTQPSGMLIQPLTYIGYTKAHLHASRQHEH